MSKIRTTILIAIFTCLVTLPSQHAQANMPYTEEPFSCAAVSEIPQSECEALVAIYNNTGGSNWDTWKLLDGTPWLINDRPCSWTGVSCQDGHVAQLNFNTTYYPSPTVGNGVRGHLPSEIANLTQLTSLDLEYNYLDSIPPEIGNLSNLITLDLRGNYLDSVPPEIGNLNSLITLDLSGNDLDSVPPEIGNLNSLITLDLRDNDLDSIPPEIGNLNSLTVLELESNRLSRIPPEIENLNSLTSLNLENNNFSSLPAEIIDLVSLEQIKLNYNRIKTVSSKLTAYLRPPIVDNNWMNTQTVAPTQLTPSVLSDSSIELTWEPIAFGRGTGYYEISIASDGDFEVHGTINNKKSESYTISGLDSDTEYDIRVRTYTSHFGQSNIELWSDYSEIISATTLTPADQYESNNECEAATTIDINGLSQKHNFYPTVDEDWSKFDAIAGEMYRIEVDIPVGSMAHVEIDIHTDCGTLADVDQSWRETFTPGALMAFEATTTGPVYLRISNRDTTVIGGHEFTYALRVRQQSDIAQIGQAIIVAGRFKEDDPLQDNIHYATNLFYETMIANSSTPDDIYYLATASELTGYDAPATLDGLEEAITQWAKERIDRDKTLTLYMVGHGAIDLFFVDDVQREVLTPDLLNGWLDTLQSAISGLKINIIIDASHAGSFIKDEHTIAGPNRIVILSTNKNRLAYASQHGIRFSDYFIDHIRRGYTLQSSFEYAKEQASLFNPLQMPWLDADGNGVPNKSQDYAIAGQQSLGIVNASLDAWPPYIEKAQMTKASSGTAQDEFAYTIQAEAKDNHDIRNIKATIVIYPPSYQTPTGELGLVQEPPGQIVELQPQGEGTYTITQNFTQLGMYKVHLYAIDDDGLRSAPMIFEIIDRTGKLYLPVIER